MTEPTELERERGDHSYRALLWLATLGMILTLAFAAWVE